MNTLALEMKEKNKAMKSYVLTIYEIVFESKPEYVLELGVGTTSQSTRTILSALKENDSGMLVSVDTVDRMDRAGEDLHKYWTMIAGDTHEEDILNKVKEITPIYDLLLIDGDHSYEGVKKDFEMYVPLVKEGGLILMHDITNERCGVPKFWEEVKLPKIAFNYGKAMGGIVPGFGIVQKIKQ